MRRGLESFYFTRQRLKFSGAFCTDCCWNQDFNSERGQQLVDFLKKDFHIFAV